MAKEGSVQAVWEGSVPTLDKVLQRKWRRFGDTYSDICPMYVSMSW